MIRKKKGLFRYYPPGLSVAGESCETSLSRLVTTLGNEK